MDMSLTDRGSNPVAQALTTALAGNPSAFAGQPSQLRLKLVRLLGEDAHTYRADVHLVVTALDENVPAELLAAAPLSMADRHRHAQILAQARGWTDEAAHTAIGLWLHGLGIESEAASEHAPSPEGDWVVSTPSAGSVSTPDPDRGSTPDSEQASDPGAPVARPGTASHDSVAFPHTSGPEDASTVLPLDRRLDPMATELPDRSSVVAFPLEPASPQGRGAPPAGPPSSGSSSTPGPATAPWPASSRFAVGQAAQREGFPIGAYYAFRGRNPHLRYAAMALVLALVAGAMFLPAGPIRLVALLAVSTGVLIVPVKLVRNGIMVVDDNGFRWYSTLSKSGPPELNVPWSAVQLAPGNPPRLLTPQGEVWLKSRKGLVEAIASRVPTAHPEQSSPTTSAR